MIGTILSIGSWVIMGVLLLLTVVFFLKLHNAGKDAYDFYIDDLDKKEWPLRDFIPMGLAFEELDIVSRFPGGLKEWFEDYNYKVYTKVLTLYGKRAGSEKYYYVHQGSKQGLRLLVLLIMAIFAPLLAYSTGEATKGLLLWLAALVVVPGLGFMTDNDLKKKIAERQQEIMLEFPVFTSKFLLLVDAGMSISRAMRKAVLDNQKENKLYVELEEMLREIDIGAAETAALEEFARRCNIREITRFVSVMVQSMNKGSADLSATLKLQTQECWESRKNLAKTLGQEASTKLVLPLMLMMVGIIFMVGGPALLMLQQF